MTLNVRALLPFVTGCVAMLGVIVLGFLVIGGAHHSDTRIGAQHAGHRGSYSGEQHREISSLSSTDVAALRDGLGWGFAKAAELNGYPGPRHVLDLDEALSLSDAQRAKIQKLFFEMQAAARAHGTMFLDAERALTAAFRNKTIAAQSLETLTRTAGQARANLRAIHLKAHLQTVAVLSDAQIAIYNRQRGYTQASLPTHSSQ
ncbi:MAG: Spy/CpxP family protein refolding chaperone [Pseudomonadota bacterium]